MHSEGVIHRDIKPANVKLTPKGQLFLLDLGLAKGGLTQQTLTGRSLHGASYGFAPPEQMAGLPTDARSDIYSLSATLYVLLTNKVPIDARVREQAFDAGVADPLKPANRFASTGKCHQQSHKPYSGRWRSSLPNALPVPPKCARN